jgi:hypothetical protein
MHLAHFGTPRHASISADKRAERGLPENLIRLCVGIEDPRDLIDDLEHSLIESGAIYERFDGNSTPATPTTTGLARDEYISDPESWVIRRASKYTRSGRHDDRAFAADTSSDNTVAELRSSKPVNDVPNLDTEQDILVSAPGKVILFGEHAVVHGVVR